MIIGIDASRAALAKHTGTETYAYQLILALAQLATKQVSFRLYTHQTPHPTNWPETPYIETQIIPFPRLWTHTRLASELIFNPPDVLFVPAHVLPYFCPIPSAVTVHDLGYLYYPESHTTFQRWYLNFTTQRHARKAQAIIADSTITKTDLIQSYQADPQKIHTVHLGYDSTLAPVTDLTIIDTTKQHYGIQGDYLLYLGTLQPRKNLLRLLEAFKTISSQSSLKLVLAGKKGWLYEQIFAKTKTLNLESKVIFPSFIAETHKAALLSGAIAYVFPSLYEGFGLPVLEAMACGVPVLCSNTSSLPEIAQDAALFIDPHSTQSITEGLTELITNATLRQTLINKGLKRVQAFSWTKSAEQILQILTNLNHKG